MRVHHSLLIDLNSKMSFSSEYQRSIEYRGRSLDVCETSMSDILSFAQKITMQTAEQNFALNLQPLAFVKSFLVLVISVAYWIKSHLIFLFDIDAFSWDKF